MWLHVDAAWAGTTLSCPEHREKAHLPAINKYADSITVNFHKVRSMPGRKTVFVIDNHLVGPNKL
jgi:glutamate/tyrosine decarboxylase-like PLP-dependent enzyme